MSICTKKLSKRDNVIYFLGLNYLLLIFFDYFDGL